MICMSIYVRSILVRNRFVIGEGPRYNYGRSIKSHCTNSFSSTFDFDPMHNVQHVVQVLCLI